MIVFNLGGALAGAISVTAIVLLLKYIPTLANGPYGNLLAGGIIFAVGLVLELTSLKPRIFFIPVSLLGLGAMSYQLWSIWHWPGLIVGIVCILIAIAFAVKTGNRAGAADLARRVDAKEKLFSGANTSDDSEVRKTLSSLIVDSPYHLDNREAVSLNADLIAFAMNRYPQLLTPEKKALLAAYQAKLVHASKSSEVNWQEFKDAKAMADLIRAVLA